MVLTKEYHIYSTGQKFGHIFPLNVSKRLTGTVCPYTVLTRSHTFVHTQLKFNPHINIGILLHVVQIDCRINTILIFSIPMLIHHYYNETHNLISHTRPKRINRMDERLMKKYHFWIKMRSHQNRLLDLCRSEVFWGFKCRCSDRFSLVVSVCLEIVQTVFVSKLNMCVTNRPKSAINTLTSNSHLNWH